MNAVADWLIGVVRAVLAGIRVVLHLVWAAFRPLVVGALQVVAALIVLFEEWGWRPLSRAMAWLARFRLIARLEGVISRLPPYPALLVFALPTVIFLPLKLVAMWLLAKGQVVAATGMFAGAKVASTALVARLFMLTKPALLRIAWFQRTYNWFMPWKTLLFLQIRNSRVWRIGRVLKSRFRRWLGRQLAELRPRMAGLIVRGRAILGSLSARLASRPRSD